MVCKQNPLEHTDPHNDRWIYRVSATFLSNQAIGTYRLLSCGNNGYDQRGCENYDGPTKNGAVIPAIDAETIIRTQSPNSPQPLMTDVAFFAWGMKAVLEQLLPLL